MIRNSNLEQLYIVMLKVLNTFRSLYKQLGIHIRFIGKTSLLPAYMEKLGRKLESLTKPSIDKR